MTRDAGGSGEHESCADFLDRIVYLLDNELEATEVAIVKVHLEECAPCFERYDVQRTIKMIVRCTSYRSKHGAHSSRWSFTVDTSVTSSSLSSR